MIQRKLRLCAATRLSREAFWETSLLGQSLRRFPPALLPDLAFRFDNEGERQEGLSTVYNRAIDTCPPGYDLVLVHDDVYLHDPLLSHRVRDGLDKFDVLGLAGSRGSALDQPSWGLAFDRELNCLGWQNGGARPEGVLLSGIVSHTSKEGRRSQTATEPPPIVLSGYGHVPSGCDLLDGLFFAVDPLRLRDQGVRFDEAFRFHLYDLDFCRSARRKGLTLSTWPILVTHGSAGNFSSAEWKAAARQYLTKWGERSASRPSSSLPAGHFESPPSSP